LLALSLAAGGLSVAGVGMPARAAITNTFPSTTMCPSTFPVSGTVLDVEDRLVVQQSSDQTTVCTRFGTDALGAGGALVAWGPNAGVPSEDANYTACQNKALIVQNVAGVYFSVATGMAPGQTWVCVQAGSTGVRIIIPISGQGSVMWYGDDGQTVGNGGPPPPPPVGSLELSPCQSEAAVAPGIDPVCVRYSEPLLG
jgi:hypothetical protein